MSVSVLHRIERAHAAATARYGPLVTLPTAVELFTAAYGPPDPWQVDVLTSDAKRQLLLCARQVGKSTVTGALAAHRALAQPGSLVLLVSPSLRQSSELFRKVSALLRQVEPAPTLVEDNRLSLQLSNGSRVVSLPGAEGTIRGFSAPSLIVEDEAARVDDEVADAVRPMLSVSGGTLILLSTPWGRRGHFYTAWEHGDGWERTKVTAAECGRISPEFLAAEQASLSHLTYQSEYAVEFVDTETQLFCSLDIKRALDPTVTPLFGAAPTPTLEDHRVVVA